MKRLFKAAQLQDLPGLLELADEVCAGLDQALAFKSKIVLEELFVNVVSYAYGGQPGPVSVDIERAGSGLRLRIEDWGAPFNPLRHDRPDLQRRFAEGRPGGAGLHLVKGMAGELRYERLAG
ncbi:ATP-binding protein, partial [Desulfovibrio sp. OttesenSCG-928-G11]|nr:ATP-binding protein [Desulfovibrio sp. OttesenSCG-928-G11]